MELKRLKIYISSYIFSSSDNSQVMLKTPWHKMKGDIETNDKPFLLLRSAELTDPLSSLS